MGPAPGIAWAVASLSRESAASLAVTPTRDFRAAMSPATRGVEKDVPLHLARAWSSSFP